MAGVADRAFREICKEFGASYLVGEMASSKGMHYHSKKSFELLAVGEKEHPIAVQIFGDDPYIMAQAAKNALEYAPDVIDINMGCPAPKIAGNGGGSALMKHPRLAGEITEAVASSVNVPVTVKFRKGWDDEHCNAVEFAHIMQGKRRGRFDCSRPYPSADVFPAGRLRHYCRGQAGRFYSCNWKWRLRRYTIGC